jgi:2-oxoglutarate ferredoxin oxidoreductase subunit gamma
MERFGIVMSGSGGQGVITAAVILAEAAVLYEDLTAVQSQAYGPEARGGAARSDVIISDSEIHFPKVIQPNVLVCLTQMAYNKFVPIIRPGGLLITDNRNVTTERRIDAKQIELPLYNLVMDEIGKPIVFNICMLGALIRLIGIVRPESILKVLEKRVPPNFIGMNQKALDLGYTLAEKFIK